MTDVLSSLIYNVPIALLFAVLAAETLLFTITGGLNRLIQERGAMLGVWFIGIVILYLRLGRKWEVSGHMAWLPMLTVQSYMLRFPWWVTALAAASTLTAVWLKFAVFRGPSGIPGIVVGMSLALVLLLLSRRGRPSKIG